MLHLQTEATRKRTDVFVGSLALTEGTRGERERDRERARVYQPVIRYSLTVWKMYVNSAFIINHDRIRYRLHIAEMTKCWRNHLSIFYLLLCSTSKLINEFALANDDEMRFFSLPCALCCIHS